MASLSPSSPSHYRRRRSARDRRRRCITGRKRPPTFSDDTRRGLVHDTTLARDHHRCHSSAAGVNMPRHSTHVALHHGAPTSSNERSRRSSPNSIRRRSLDGTTRFDRPSDREPRIFPRMQVAVLKLSAAIGSCRNRSSGETFRVRTRRLSVGRRIGLFGGAIRSRPAPRLARRCESTNRHLRCRRARGAIRG